MGILNFFENDLEIRCKFLQEDIYGDMAILIFFKNDPEIRLKLLWNVHLRR